jgi:hypothetical protein
MKRLSDTFAQLIWSGWCAIVMPTRKPLMNRCPHHAWILAVVSGIASVPRHFLLVAIVAALVGAAWAAAQEPVEPPPNAPATVEWNAGQGRREPVRGSAFSKENK